VVEIVVKAQAVIRELLSVVDTPMHTNDDPEFLKKLHPIPRLVQISEIVEALFYLQSAPMVNGENIRIDGDRVRRPTIDIIGNKIVC
jgi:NAD(P)-dependent dehydrogenase (short-subunit alcohol dehydrogenase family)